MYVARIMMHYNYKLRIRTSINIYNAISDYCDIFLCNYKLYYLMLCANNNAHLINVNKYEIE